MPRIRSIKPELWQSPQVMNLSHSARLLFIGLITQADDHGKGSSDIRKLRAAVFPGDDVKIEQLRAWLDEIRSHYLAVFYHAEGFGDLYLLPSWSEHQYVQKRQGSRYPDPADSELPERYRKATGSLPGDRKDRKDQGSDARERVPVKAGTLRAAGDDAEVWLTGGTA
jgi:hypothetical protein